MSSQTDEPQNPGVQFPPPVLYVLSGLFGSAIESKVPLPLSKLIALPAQIKLGWTATVLGAVFLLWGMLTFVATKTAIYPNQAARTLVEHGPYRISRNPMYVALTVIALGAGLLADNFWMLILLPIVLIVLTKFVIQREENYLIEAFGDSYRDYQSRVRRWL